MILFWIVLWIILGALAVVVVGALGYIAYESIVGYRINKRVTERMAYEKILLYENRKCDPVAFDASTPELEAAAYLKLFKLLDEDWQVYECGDLKADHKKWYQKAKTGDAVAAEKLLRARRDYEYETWQSVNVL